MNINIRLVDMPCRIHALTRSNDDGSYTVVVNSRLSQKAQETAYMHEIRHIMNDDLLTDERTDEIERTAHLEGTR